MLTLFQGAWGYWCKKHSDMIKIDSPGVNYQESVSVPVSKEADNDAATQEGGDGVDIICEYPEASADPEFILPVVDKVSFQIMLLDTFQPWLIVL